MKFSKPTRCANEGKSPLGPRLRFGLICLALGLAWAAPLEAAEALVTASGSDEIVEDVFLRPRRELLQQLNNSKRLLEQQRYSEAVRALGRILDCKDDYYIRPDGNGRGDNGPAFHSLKSEARRLIAEMPRRGRDLYELEYGTKAKQRLRDAAAAQDVAAIAEVSRRYFHTEAGSEATLLLGLCYLDRGKPLAAARILSRLAETWDGGARHEPTLAVAMAVCWAQAGLPDKANECLESLRSRYPSGKIIIGGLETTIFDEGETPLDWLEALTGALYVKASGNTKGDAGDGIPLLNTLWRVPSSEQPLAERLMLGQLRYCRDRGLSLLTAGRPLAVDNTVLMRTLSTLQAVDFQTGKRLWMLPFKNLLDDENVSARTAHRQPAPRTGALCNRYWRDGIYGSLSSDERLVYSVEDLDLGAISRTSRFIIMGGRPVENPDRARGHNRLVAHDIRTGKLVWQIGGPPQQIGRPIDQPAGGNGPDDEILPAAGSFFLGAGLCLSDRLYLLAELDGEILLTVVEADSGKVLWTQQLAVVERPVWQDGFRRYQVAVPTYADGILVCPTGNGAVAAVEEATRSLLWGYPFPYDAKKSRMNRGLRLRAVARIQLSGLDNGADSSWLRGEPVIVGDRVLLTDPLTDHLHCVGLFDGKLHWKSLRKGDLFIACADRERVVLVGRRSVRALKIADGKQAWDKRSVPLEDNASTSGRGFLAGGYYYLPTGSAGVTAINVRSGEIELVSKSREGNVPGNLVLHKGKVLSQGLDGLKNYYELGSLRRRVDAILAKHPDNAVALSLRGEILVDEGKRDQAIEVLRRAYRQTRGARTEWLLRKSLLEGLAEDFDKHRADRAEIEQLCKDSKHLARYLRTMAEGFEGLGEWDAALDCYLRLADIPKGHGIDLWLSDSHKVRLDRWLWVRLAAFQNSASAAARQRLNDEAKARLRAARAALASGNLDAMRRFLDQFAHHPAAVEGRADFVDSLVGDGNLIEAEMLLRQQARSKDRAVGGRATIRLAEVLRKAGRLEDAAGCYRRLAFEFADVACTDGLTGASGLTGVSGLTGKEVVRRLPKDDAVRRWFQPDKSWPLGVVEVTESFPKTKSRPRSRRYLTDLNFHGSRQPFFGNRRLKIERGKNIVTSVGAYGNLLWQLPLTDGKSQTRYHINPNEEYVSARGHLLVLAAGEQYTTIDCVDPRRPRVLWRHHSEQTLPGLSNVDQAEIKAFWAGMQPPRGAAGRSTRHPWQACVLTDLYMCYHKFHSVVALDPLSGRELWTHGGLPKNCTLFGDEHLLFVVPPNSVKATVLRGVDGQKLKTVTIPSRSERLATIGRLVLVWRTEGNRRIVEMVDPWKNRTVWGPCSFDALAKSHLVGNEALGIMEPSGRFTLLSLSDGKKKIEAQLRAEPHLHEIVLLETDGEYFLVTHSTERRRGGHTPRAIRDLASRLIRQGRVYGFDRNGKRLWPDFPQGVEVTQQQLLLCQPSRLPVLVFACTRHDPNNRSSRWHTSVLMIDKRNGRVVLDKKVGQQATNFELSGDPAGNTVDLLMRHGNLRLAFTDKPLPPVVKKLPVKVKPAGTLDGILKAFEKMMPR